MTGSKTGSYALLLQSAARREICVGRAGTLVLMPGFYVYVGSAFGPGGVAARTGHHLRVTSRPHWHIDYLRRETVPVELWWSFDPLAREHHWAEVLQSSPGTSMPLPGFGASDCNCPAHLYFSSTRPAFRRFSRRLHGIFPGHARLYHKAVS